MFTFEDLGKSTVRSRRCCAPSRRTKLGPRPGSSDAVLQRLLLNMSERAGKILKEDMEGMGGAPAATSTRPRWRWSKRRQDHSRAREIMLTGKQGEDELV